MDDSGPDCVRLLDDQTFETLDRHQLDNMEVCCSISSMAMADDPALYYVVGTAISIPEEPEPSKVCYRNQPSLLTRTFLLLTGPASPL